MEQTFVSVSAVIACHVCPLRYYLTKGIESAEPVRYTMTKQLSYALGTAIDATELWKEIALINPAVTEDDETSFLAWTELCREQEWNRAEEYDVKVRSERLGVRGTIDRFCTEKPYISIVRSSEAPEAGIYQTDRIRAACLIAAANETLNTKTEEALIEYVPSGVTRTCVPQPRDRRLMMRAITAAQRVDAGILPKKPRDAPCETCELKDYCTTQPTPLSERI